MNIGRVAPTTQAEARLREHFLLFPNLFAKSDLSVKADTDTSGGSGNIYTLSQLSVSISVKFVRVSANDIPKNVIKNKINNIATKVLIGSILMPLDSYEKIKSFFLITHQTVVDLFHKDKTFVHYAVHDKNKNHYFFYHDESTNEAIAIVLKM